ncbi:MAG: HAD hydrolase-like protein, partial [Pseudomonadota bacterium]
GAELIAIHKNRFWQTDFGLKMDIGGFVVALEYASGKPALTIGKPSADFFRMALKSMDLSASDVAIIGDDIDSDVGGAQAVGMTGILVKTGKFREEYVAQSRVTPDWVIDSIRELPAFLSR